MSAPITAELPDSVYAPSTGGADGGQVVLARDLSGDAELLCFSSPELLRRGLGPQTPWLLLRRDEVERLVHDDHVTRLQLDPVLEPDEGGSEASPASETLLPTQRPARQRERH
jgi:hypothetical protein